MARSKWRDLVGALLGGIALAAGLVAFVLGSGWLTLLVGTCAGSLVLFLDIYLTSHPVKRDSRLGRWVMPSLLLVAVSAGLLSAGLIGHDIQSDPQEYPFIVTNAAGVTTIVKTVPNEDAQGNRLFATGDGVMVKCYVDVQDWRWFKLSEEQGWLRGDEVYPEPHTGLGSPPRCPD